MDLRHLRYFIAVAEEGSLTNAAERRLHTTQPSLSRQIRDLLRGAGRHDRANHPSPRERPRRRQPKLVHQLAQPPDRHGDGQRVTKTTWYRYRRRSDRFTGPHPLQHTGDLPRAGLAAATITSGPSGVIGFGMGLSCSDGAAATKRRV